MSRLHRAARLGNAEDIAACLAQGADINAFSVHHVTALMLAAQEGHPAIVRLLLAAGADVRLAHPNGRTALHFAAGKGHLEVVTVLVAHGADVNARSRNGCTAAIEAAKFVHGDVARFLLQQGTDASFVDNFGFTAEAWLAQGGVPGYFKDRFPDIRSLPHVQEKAEQEVRRLMSEGFSADEYAARHGRRILVWSYGQHHFSDSEVEQWACRVAEVLFTPGLLDQCEERFLQGDELEEARRFRERRARHADRRARKP